MQTADFVAWAVKGLYLSLILSLPMVVAAALVGTLLAIVQALTQIQEQTLSYGIKLIATGVALALTMGWIAAELLAYATALFDMVPLAGR
jgi:type III secretion protein S